MRICVVGAVLAVVSSVSLSASADAPDRVEDTRTQEVDFASEAGLVSWMDQARTLNFATAKMAPTVSRVSPQARLQQLELRWEVSRDQVRLADGVWADSLERELQDLRTVVEALDKQELSEISRRQRRQLNRRIERLARSIEFARHIRVPVDFAEA